METAPVVEKVDVAEVEIPLTVEIPIQVAPTAPPIQQSQRQPENAELPPWMMKMLKRQDFLNQKYEHAHALFAQAYNDFLSSIDEINFENDTRFTFHQAVKEYGGHFAADALIDEEDDED